MNWLLKIVDGPMKGAEIALLGGRRTSIGSSDDCDLVIADQALPAKACELDVSESAVTVLVEGGEAKILPPFEICSFGTTAIAVGPAEGAWQPLVMPKAEEKKVEAEGADDGEGVGEGEEKVDADGDAKADGEAEAEAASEKPPKHRRKGFGCLLGLILLLAVLFLLWFFWGRIVDRWPVVEMYRIKTVETVEGWWQAGKRLVITPEPVLEKGPTLEEIAATYGLVYTPASGDTASARLVGNVARRTERQAIRALALAEDPTVKFDLTDDESLHLSANELLFAMTEGALKAVSASNRVVTVAGFAPSAERLEAVARALVKDVPAVERLDLAAVQIGGTPPKEVAETAFVAPQEPVRKPTSPKKAASRPDYPIAGILAKPYPCVVMRNGLRLCEGAQVGTAVIVSIAPDRLILKEGGHEFEWRP